jgi:hypothetical protein
MRLAIQACGGVVDERVQTFVRQAGLAWGISGVLRAEPFWRARGRRRVEGAGCSHPTLIGRARAAHAEARALAPGLPSLVFPAIGYVALTPGYLRALERGLEAPALLTRQLRLIGAAATGRL